MKVDGPGSLKTDPARRAGRTAGAGSRDAFLRALREREGAPAPAGASGIQAPVAVNPLLALQEVDDATAGSARARQRAADILDRLDEIRIALLEGRLPREQLAALAHLVNSQREQVDDPRLSALLDEIDLRAQVELAKLTAR